MNISRIIVQIVAIVIVAALVADRAKAASGNRKTLLQWSYGTSFEGGPDLDEPLITDRPDFTESSVTVGYGVAQLEMGYTFTYDSANGDRTRSHSFPETLLRLGTLAEWFEFRIDWNFADETTEIGGIEDSISGAEDLGLGIKLALTPQECLLPETAIIFQMTVPSGSSDVTADEVLPGFNYLYGWDINDEWSTGGSTGINRSIDEGTLDAFLELSQSWTVNRSLGENAGSFAEWFVLGAHSGDSIRPEHYFNGGFTYRFNNDIQWDIRAGVGLNDAADDFFAGTGLALRYR
jgi:hypothetical protein